MDAFVLFLDYFAFAGLAFADFAKVDIPETLDKLQGGVRLVQAVVVKWK